MFQYAMFSGGVSPPMAQQTDRVWSDGMTTFAAAPLQHKVYQERQGDCMREQVTADPRGDPVAMKRYADIWRDVKFGRRERGFFWTRLLSYGLQGTGREFDEYDKPVDLSASNVDDEKPKDDLSAMAQRHAHEA